MTAIQEMVRNVNSARFETFDSRTVEYAKDRIIDTVGAMIGGGRASGVKMVMDLIKGWGGKKEATILATRYKVPAANAVLVMGIMARANDYEPAGGPEIQGKKCPGHYSATTVPTALVEVEKLELGGKDLITALIVGDDLASRIGIAGAAPWDIGWDPAATCSRFGATVVAGKLMGLSEHQMLNALGIVYNQISGTMQPVLDLTHTPQFMQGLSGWNGIVSAELAARGFTGSQDPLTSQFGFFKQFSRDFDVKFLTQNLGKKFYADEEFKTYPCCRGNSGSIENTLKLVGENNIDPDKIREITVALSPVWNNSFLIQPFSVGEFPQASAIFSLRYNVASVILRKNVNLNNFTDQAVCDPDIVAISDKIKINTSTPGKFMASRVTITMKDGRTFSSFTEIPHGDFNSSPLTREEIKDKFKASADFSRIINKDQVKNALELLQNLESVDDISLLVKILTPASSGKIRKTLKPEG